MTAPGATATPCPAADTKGWCVFCVRRIVATTAMVTWATPTAPRPNGKYFVCGKCAGSRAAFGHVFERSAIFSPCRTWRYTLTRTWNPALPVLVCLGLNPSTANETEDDPTIRRVIAFARAWGFGGIVMLNIYAFRSTDPEWLFEQPEAGRIGPENDAHIARVTRDRRVLCAWGAFQERPDVEDRVGHICHLMGWRDLVCLGRTKKGAPRHPLYVPAATAPAPFCALWG